MPAVCRGDVMRHRNPWLLWVAATAGSFAYFEMRAVRYREVPTLSEELARWAGVNPRHPRGVVVPVLWVAACCWLTVHVLRWEGATP